MKTAKTRPDCDARRLGARRLREMRRPSTKTTTRSARARERPSAERGEKRAKPRSERRIHGSMMPQKRRWRQAKSKK